MFNIARQINILEKEMSYKLTTKVQSTQSLVFFVPLWRNIITMILEH